MFKEFYQKLDKQKVIDILENSSAPIYEATLLKAGFNGIEISIDNTFKMFQSHFVLFYFLYKKQIEYEKHNRYLHIYFMNIHLLDYPPKGLCHYYNEIFSNFCNTKTKNNYCNFHQNQFKENKLEHLSLKHFYLDENNFNLLNEKTAKAFINGAFEILYNYDFYEKSFKILGVSKDSNFTEIKKRFYKLSKETHPDMGGNDINKFIKINNAYQFLKKIIPHE
jgi:hypothetical protein